MKKCPNCQTENFDRAQTCVACGYKLTTSPQVVNAQVSSNRHGGKLITPEVVQKRPRGYKFMYGVAIFAAILVGFGVLFTLILACVPAFQDFMHAIYLLCGLFVALATVGLIFLSEAARAVYKDLFGSETPEIFFKINHFMGMALFIASLVLSFIAFLYFITKYKKHHKKAPTILSGIVLVLSIIGIIIHVLT